MTLILTELQFQILSVLPECRRKETLSNLKRIEDRLAARLTKCNINTYCKFCKSEGKPKVKCTKKAKYRAFDHRKHYACEEHKRLIEDTDPDGRWEFFNSPEGKAKRKKEMQELEWRDRKNGYSEADYQTWLRV